MSKNRKPPGDQPGDRIWGNQIPIIPTGGGKCPACHENVNRCVCCPTDDGPGQEDSEGETA